MRQKITNAIKKLGRIIAGFLMVMLLMGLCMLIDKRGYLALAALCALVVFFIVCMMKSKDPFNKNKKAFARGNAELVKQIPGFAEAKNIAVVFDLASFWPSIGAVRLESKNLYNEEDKLWGAAYGSLFYRKLGEEYKSGEEDLARIVKYCASELGKDYVGFVHYSFARSGGSVETFNLSYENGGTERVTVMEGGGAYFGALGIICHKEYYQAFKSQINYKKDSFIYTRKREKFLKKEAKNKKPW